MATCERRCADGYKADIADGARGTVLARTEYCVVNSRVFRFCFEGNGVMTLSIDLIRRVRYRKLKSGEVVEPMRYVLDWCGLAPGIGMICDLARPHPACG
jgi:hypothetical protein